MLSEMVTRGNAAKFLVLVTVFATHGTKASIEDVLVSWGEINCKFYEAFRNPPTFTRKKKKVSRVIITYIPRAFSNASLKLRKTKKKKTTNFPSNAT